MNQPFIQTKMKKFEVRKVWEDGTSQIEHQELDELGAASLCYSYNKTLPVDTKFYFKSIEQERIVPINLRIRS